MKPKKRNLQRYRGQNLQTGDQILWPKLQLSKNGLPMRNQGLQVPAVDQKLKINQLFDDELYVNDALWNKSLNELVPAYRKKSKFWSTS